MTIKGDMVATLVSKGETKERATELVAALLDCISGPDFAFRYAREKRPDDNRPHDFLRLQYWGFTDFLKEMA